MLASTHSQKDTAERRRERFQRERERERDRDRHGVTS